MSAAALPRPDALRHDGGALAPSPASPAAPSPPPRDAAAPPHVPGPRVGPIPTPAAAPPADLIRRCAWCRRIAHADGSWRHSDDPTPATLPVRTTHGICPACYAAAARV